LGIAYESKQIGVVIKFQALKYFGRASSQLLPQYSVLRSSQLLLLQRCNYLEIIEVAFFGASQVLDVLDFRDYFSTKAHDK
jgi:hypothetical protein